MLITVSACFRAKGFWSCAYRQSECYRLGEHKIKLYLTSCTVSRYCIWSHSAVAPKRVLSSPFFGFFGEVIPLRPYSIYATVSSAKSMATSEPIIEDAVETAETLQRPAIAVHVRSSTPNSRSDSGTIISTSGQSVAYHSRTAEERDATPPHAFVPS